MIVVACYADTRHHQTATAAAAAAAACVAMATPYFHPHGAVVGGPFYSQTSAARFTTMAPVAGTSTTRPPHRPAPSAVSFTDHQFKTQPFFTGIYASS